MFSVYFNACAKYPQISLESFESKIFSIKNANNAYVLYISHSDESYHFALFDTLGSPVASKILQDSTLKNAKFLPPNAKFDEIFIECLNMLKEAKTNAIFLDYEIMAME